MKKTYRLNNLDCANCAAKMERSIAKLEGVNEVSISFMLQKMSIDYDDESIMQEVVCLIKKVEPDCDVVM